MRFHVLRGLLLGVVVLTGCAADTEVDDEGTDEGALSGAATPISACPQQHVAKDADGDTVVVCDATYGVAPLVRPPADVTGDKAVLYAALAIRDTPSSFVDRSGTAYAILGSDGKPVDLKNGPANALSRQLRMPSNRYLYLVYRVEGRITTTHDEATKKDVPAIVVTKAAPAVMLPGKVIDAAQIGAWEGWLPEHIPGGAGFRQFDATKHVPVRVSFTKVASNPPSKFRKWQDGSLADGEAYTVVGTVENFDKPAKASDGTCYPALSSLGDKNPFGGATKPDVSLQRVAGMHFPGDDEHVFTVPAGASGWSPTTMGTFGRFRMSDFLAEKPEAGTMHPHGMPTGAEITLGGVTGGGGSCTP